MHSTFYLTDTSQNQRHSTFLQLPGEIRNIIYNMVASNVELQFGAANLGDKDKAAINLSKTSRQIHNETQLLPYAMMSLHIHDWVKFITWLQRRTMQQLGAIRRLNIHITIYLDNVTDFKDLQLGKPSHTVPANACKTWPTLRNIQTVDVYVHPYKSGATVLDPRFSQYKILWDRRAQQIADSFADQLSLFHCNDKLRLIGRWDSPWSSPRLDNMKACFDDDTMYTDSKGNWRCRRRRCNTWNSPRLPHDHIVGRYWRSLPISRYSW
jgi:hypothetical protein